MGSDSPKPKGGADIKIVRLDNPASWEAFVAAVMGLELLPEDQHNLVLLALDYYQLALMAQGKAGGAAGEVFDGVSDAPGFKDKE